MKKLIICILIGVFCLTSGAGLLAATASAHHPSFWVQYGKWIAGVGVVWWLVDESKHHKPYTPPAEPAPKPEMLPGDRALHNVYGDNIPQVK